MPQGGSPRAGPAAAPGGGGDGDDGGEWSAMDVPVLQVVSQGVLPSTLRRRRLTCDDSLYELREAQHDEEAQRRTLEGEWEKEAEIAKWALRALAEGRIYSFFSRMNTLASAAQEERTDAADSPDARGQLPARRRLYVANILRGLVDPTAHMHHQLEEVAKGLGSLRLRTLCGRAHTAAPYSPTGSPPSPQVPRFARGFDDAARTPTAAFRQGAGRTTPGGVKHRPPLA